MSAVAVRLMHPDEAPEVSALALRSFDDYVGHEFSAEGVESFTAYADANQLLARHQTDHFTLVAFVDDVLAGMIEFRKNRHLSMLFVAEEFHRRGISRHLYRTAWERARAEDPELERVTVNASRYAVPAYERLGFQAAGEEQTTNGITFVPMEATPGAAHRRAATTVKDHDDDG